MGSWGALHGILIASTSTRPSSLGETRDLFLSVPAGALSAGTFVARVNLVKEHAFWFETRGAHPSEFELKLVSSGHVHVALSGGASRRSAKNKPKSPNIAVVWRSQLTAKPARSSPAARPSMTNSL